MKVYNNFKEQTKNIINIIPTAIKIRKPKKQTIIPPPYQK